MPDTGYHFVSWSDGVLTAARTDANVTADVNVTANFAINTYTLTYTAGAGGTISGTTPQTVNYGADGTIVTAVPDPGYHFVELERRRADGGAHRHQRDGGRERDGELRAQHVHADLQRGRAAARSRAQRRRPSTTGRTARW